MQSDPRRRAEPADFGYAVDIQFGFGDDEPKKKLMVYLGMQKNWNTFTLLSTSEEAIYRVGLNKLAPEEIYEIRPGELIDSAVL